MTNTTSSRSSLVRYHHLLLAVFWIMIAAVSIHSVNKSSAATYSSNPAGVADYCTLSGNVTTIYGWAYDPDAPAGVQPYVKLVAANAPATGYVPSNIAGYRDAPINTWIGTHYPGAPKPGTYGWVQQFQNLYKGTAYTLSGTVLNYAAGINAALGINSNSNVDGDTSKPYFAGGKIPDACLMTPPAPTPPPTPTPTPTPKPVVTPKPTTPTPPLSAAADGSITVGTTSAVIKVPADNATSIHLLYGNEPTTPTETQNVSGADITFTLKDLKPKTSYKYQIVRSLGSQTTTSPASEFTTSGYSLALVFTSKDQRSGKAIEVELNGKKIKSDDHGTARFDDLAPGTYSPKFIYIGQSYTEQVTVSTNTPATAGQTAVTTKSINLDAITLSSHNANTASSGVKAGPLAVLGGLGLVALLVAAWFIRRFFSGRLAAEGTTVPSDPYIMDQPSAPTYDASSQPIAMQPHTGVSLKDMVLESMHAESAAHYDDTNPPAPSS